MASSTVHGDTVAGGTLTADVPFTAMVRGSQGSESDGALAAFPFRNGHLESSTRRALLATWPSDANAVPGRPALRRIPGTGRIVSIDAILDALEQLDSEDFRRLSACPAPKPSTRSRACAAMPP